MRGLAAFARSEVKPRGAAVPAVCPAGGHSLWGYGETPQLGRDAGCRVVVGIHPQSLVEWENEFKK